MKLSIFLLVISLFFSQYLIAQDATVTGVWKAVDDQDGKVSSLIEITNENGQLSGTIKEIYKRDPSSLCINCKGDRHNQPVLGMEIIWDMEKDGDTWKGGRILDPENGKVYKCKIALDEEDPNVLEVRGFIGISLVGRTQKWERYTGEE